MLRHLLDRIKGTVPAGTKRSNQWPKVREEFLKLHPSCALCGGKKKLEVHHKQPFHMKPALELDTTNLITLCEEKKNGVNCHLFCGHIGDFKAVNTNVVFDANSWNIKLRARNR